MRKYFMNNLNPYLFFDGNCEEAFNFYRSIFDKELRLFRYKDVPQTDKHIFREEDDKIMHCSLPINAETTLMGCDITGLSKQSEATNNFALLIHAGSREEADQLFKELSAGGQIKVPMTDTFWGCYYGFFTDKFGI